MDRKFECSSCSKESYSTIPIARILQKLDEHFATNDLAGAGKLLEYWEREARILHDERGLIEILNEQIGYFRRTGDKEKGLAAVNESFELIVKSGAEENASFGTVYLNGATTMKAFGMSEEAMEYYARAKEIYDRTLQDDDYMLAAFYNNISSAYKDLGQIENAESACLKAIEILKKNDGKLGEMAVTCINLAHLYYDSDPCDERVYERMEKAWEYLRSSENVHDGNFAFICSKCYPSFGFFGYFEYEKILREMTKKIYAGN